MPVLSHLKVYQMQKHSHNLPETMKKFISSHIEKTDSQIKTDHFHEGKSVKIMRNKNTGVLYLVQRKYSDMGNFDYCFYPFSRSARKSFFKNTLDNYQEAGTDYQNKILQNKVCELNLDSLEFNSLMTTLMYDLEQAA